MFSHILQVNIFRLNKQSIIVAYVLIFVFVSKSRPNKWIKSGEFDTIQGRTNVGTGGGHHPTTIYLKR